jgi:small subunit ribosomal protein S9
VSRAPLGADVANGNAVDTLPELRYHSPIGTKAGGVFLSVEQEARRLPKRVGDYIHAVGRRKAATARVYLREGDGTFTINRRPVAEYFASYRNPVDHMEKALKVPFYATGTVGKYDVKATVRGGGFTGQLEAVRLGIARALCGVTEEYRTPLKRAGLLTRDAREVERKKINRRKARKSEQYSKR